MVLAYNFLIYSEVIREIMHPFFFSYKEKSKVQLVGSSLFLKETTRTHPLSKKDQYTKDHT